MINRNHIESLVIQEPTTFTPLHIDFKDADWRYTIGYALGHMLLPILIVLSKLLKREIAFMEYTKKESE